MSLTVTGTFTRSGGIYAAVFKHTKQLNLKAIQRVVVSFDPFGKNVQNTREFLFQLSTPKVRQTNPSCIVRTEILSKREEPTVVFHLNKTAQESVDFESIKIRTENLNILEILEECNKHVTPLAPKEAEDTKVIETKATKAKRRK